MDNFDLKKYLVENKVTTNSQMNENSMADIISTLVEKENIIVDNPLQILWELESRGRQIRQHN